MKKNKNERYCHSIDQSQKSSESPEKIRNSPISCAVEGVKLRFKNHNKEKYGYISTRKSNNKKFPPLSPRAIEKPHNHANKYGVFKNYFECFIFRVEIFESEVDNESPEAESQYEKSLSIIGSKMPPIFYPYANMKESETYLEYDDVGYDFLEHKLKKDDYFSSKDSLFCIF